MSDLVGNPEDRFSRVAAQIIKLDSKKKDLVIIELQHNKTYFYICKNKGADQLHSGKHAADRRLRFHYILNPKFRPLPLQPDLCPIL